VLALEPDDAGDISLRPRALARAVAGNGQRITAVSVDVVAFVPPEADDTWHAVAAAVRKMTGWA
jgi:hypothetical protein